MAARLDSERDKFLSAILFVLLLAWIAFQTLTPLVEDAVSRLRV